MTSRCWSALPRCPRPSRRARPQLFEPFVSSRRVSRQRSRAEWHRTGRGGRRAAPAPGRCIARATHVQTRAASCAPRGAPPAALGSAGATGAPEAAIRVVAASRPLLLPGRTPALRGVYIWLLVSRALVFSGVAATGKGGSGGRVGTLLPGVVRVALGTRSWCPPLALLVVLVSFVVSVASLVVTEQVAAGGLLVFSGWVVVCRGGCGRVLLRRMMIRMRSVRSVMRGTPSGPCTLLRLLLRRRLPRVRASTLATMGGGHCNRFTNSTLACFFRSGVSGHLSWRCRSSTWSSRLGRRCRRSRLSGRWS